MTRGEFYDRLIYLRENVGNYNFKHHHRLLNVFLIEIDDSKEPNDLDSIIEQMKYTGIAFMLSEKMYIYNGNSKWGLITDITLSDDGYYYLETV